MAQLPDASNASHVVAMPVLIHNLCVRTHARTRARKRCVCTIKLASKLVRNQRAATAVC